MRKGSSAQRLKMTQFTLIVMLDFLTFFVTPILCPYNGQTVLNTGFLGKWEDLLGEYVPLTVLGSIEQHLGTPVAAGVVAMLLSCGYNIAEPKFSVPLPASKHSDTKKKALQG